VVSFGASFAARTVADSVASSVANSVKCYLASVPAAAGLGAGFVAIPAGGPGQTESPLYLPDLYP